MIKIREAVIVEGKYDKIKLSNFLDALIVETNGFGIYKDKERLAFIRRLAKERGIILLTDSDHSGFQIRSYIANGIPKDRIKHLYIPDIYGREKRKKVLKKRLTRMGAYNIIMQYDKRRNSRHQSPGTWLLSI